MEALWRFFLFSKDSRVFSAIFDFHNGLETFVKTPWKCNSSPHHFSGGWLGRRWRLHRWGLSPPYCGEDEPNFGEAYFFQVGWWTNNQLVNFLFKCVSFFMELQWYLQVSVWKDACWTNRTCCQRRFHPCLKRSVPFVTEEEENWVVVSKMQLDEHIFKMGWFNHQLEILMWHIFLIFWRVGIARQQLR